MCLLQVPIIAPVKQKKFQIENKSVPTNYSDEFLVGLLNSPSLTRNIAVAGHLHHGKTVVSCLLRKLQPYVLKTRDGHNLCSHSFIAEYIFT